MERREDGGGGGGGKGAGIGGDSAGVLGAAAMEVAMAESVMPPVPATAAASVIFCKLVTLWQAHLSRSSPAQELEEHDANWSYTQRHPGARREQRTADSRQRTSEKFTIQCLTQNELVIRSGDSRRTSQTPILPSRSNECAVSLSHRLSNLVLPSAMFTLSLCLRSRFLLALSVCLPVPLPTHNCIRIAHPRSVTKMRSSSLSCLTLTPAQRWRWLFTALACSSCQGQRYAHITRASSTHHIRRFSSNPATSSLPSLPPPLPPLTSSPHRPRPSSPFSAASSAS